MRTPITVDVVDSRTERESNHNNKPDAPRADWLDLVIGVALVVLGVLCIAFPGSVLKGFTQVIGIGVILGAVCGIITCYRTNLLLPSGLGSSYVMPIITLCLGILLVVSPVIGVSVFGFIAGIAIGGYGLFRIVTASVFGPLTVIPLIGRRVSGVVMLVLGVLMIIWPKYLAVLLGIFVIFYGVEMFISGLPIGQKKD